MWTAKVGNTEIQQYGGIGLTIEQDGDGVWRTKCIVDAEVFAILDPSGATGVNARHPFIIKDGVVYMNKLLLDDAEIGNMIAQYINVQDLVAVTITASTIKSSDNGVSFQLLPDGTMSCTKATIKGAITATSGSFTGTVNANAGTFNNVTIAQNCNVLGTVYANRIVGDVCKTLAAPSPNFTLTFPAFNRARKIAIVGPTGTLMKVRTTINSDRLFYVKIFVNGNMISETTTYWQPGYTLGEFEVATQNALIDLPANTNAVVEYRVGSRDANIELDYTLVRAGVMVASAFIQ